MLRAYDKNSVYSSDIERYWAEHNNTLKVNTIFIVVHASWYSKNNVSFCFVNNIGDISPVLFLPSFFRSKICFDVENKSACPLVILGLG